MSFYNMLFGMNPQADFLLAVVGLKKNDVERFRNVSTSEDGKTIEVYTRTGGGNRDDYPQELMRHMAGWRRSVDDDFDSTYCTDTFDVPEEFVEDVKNLNDILAHGMRKEFALHIAKTLRREPTEGDKATQAYEEESRTLARTEHFMANGHTFVPKNDAAMEAALKLAEANAGKLKSCWGILPMKITVKMSERGYPNRTPELGYVWEMDAEYWAHCREKWAGQYPTTMATIEQEVAKYTAKQGGLVAHTR